MCRNLRDRLIAGAAVLVLAGCNEPAGAPDSRLSPRVSSFEEGGCSAEAVYQLVDQTFTGETRHTVSSLVNNLCTFKEEGDQSNATWVGFQILDHIATSGRIQGSPETASELAKAVLRCMTVGSVTLPTSFAGALSPGGAFSVRGFESGDSRLVASEPPDAHTDINWVIEPPVGQTWRTITSLTERPLADSVSHLFLAFGAPSSIAEPDFTHDILKSDVFDWATLPVAHFDLSKGGAIVGVCDDQAPFFIQHQPVGQQDVEILGFVSPACPGPALLGALKQGRSSPFAGLVRFFTPTPAYAAFATTGTAGGKGSLSPFGKVDPGAVNLGYTSVFQKHGYSVNTFIRPTINIAASSNGGAPFRQNGVFTWLEAVTNNGLPAKLCNNYAFANEAGQFQFPKAYFTKPGGYTIVAHTQGTVSDPHDGFVPHVPPGQVATSPIVNVKNSSAHAPAPCMVYKAGDPIPPAPGPNG